jgi:hypothetical protein
MQNYILLAGRVAGFLGILACIVAVGTRLTGSFYLAGIEAGSLLQGGIAATVIGSFLLLLAKR